MYNEKEMIAILEDDYPIEPSGTTRADKIARVTGITGIDKEQYETVFGEVMKHIPYKEWSFLVKFMSFIRNAKFEKPFYEAFASFIKEKFSEANPGGAPSAIKTFLRGKCIQFIAESFKDLFDFEWIKETSFRLQLSHHWVYLDLIKIYEPEKFLIEMDKILTLVHEYKNDLTTEILNYSPQLMSLFSKDEITPYFEKWKVFIPKNKQREYGMMIQYYLNKEESVKL